MTFTSQIGSGRALFVLPGGRFDQITTNPIPPIKTKEAKKP